MAWLPFQKNRKLHSFLNFSYAGPGMQVAKHEWKQSWANYLASSRGWIVAQIDGRGSGGEGDRRRFEIWHQLGSVEVADQVLKRRISNNTKNKIEKMGIIQKRHLQWRMSAS